MAREWRLPALLGLVYLVITSGCSSAVPTTSPLPPEAPGAASTPGAVAPIAWPEAMIHPWFRIEEPEPGADTLNWWILGVANPAQLGLGGTLLSDVTELGDETVEVALVSAGDGCRAGDVGTYGWTLSESGRVLTFTAESDECAVRRTALDASWIKSDCPAFPENFCLGPLDAGLHSANYFTPLVPSATWEFDPGAITYRVSQGWSNTYDSANEYTLEPLDKTGDTGVYLWTDVTLVSESSPCGPAPARGGRATPAAMAAWLADQGTLDTSDATSATIGELQGLSLDLEVSQGAILSCTGDGVPFVPMLVHVEGSGLQWGFKAGVANRLYLLDLGDGRTLVIHVAAEGELAQQRFREGIEIVESISLRR